MTNDLVKRLRESAEGWDDCGDPDNAKMDREAADRIEELEKALKQIASRATLTEEMAANWREFCEASIADRIEELEKQLSVVNETLEVTITETMTGTTAENWKKFCEALIEETRELLGETNE